MEVHAHTHTARKKWTHYLWEFLMLFLAVFCGFLAENKREHMIEHKREKKYMISLLEDVKSDTLLLKNALAFNKNRILIVDTLLAEMAKGDLFTDCRKVYNLSNQSGFWDFVSNDGTMQQLKTASGLRLIRNQKVVDAILQYDKDVRGLYINQGIFNNFMISWAEKHINFFPTMSLEANSGQPVPLKKDKSTLEVFYGVELTYKTFLELLVGPQESLLKKGIKLIQLIKTEYNLK
jgi:hypothetical protein